MAGTNDILAFCPTDTGTNLLDNATYLAAADRTSGNKPGVASAKLNNKAIRQATYVASQMAQLLANNVGSNVLDDATPARLLAQFTAGLSFYPPNLTKYTSGSGTHNPTYFFYIATGSATAAATYTNNGNTYTVVTTVASGTFIKMTGPGAPTASGTLTKASGTGDSTLTFYAARAPIALKVKMVGAGGGGGGTGAGAAGGGTGGNTTFGTTLLVASGGVGGSNSAVIGGVGGAVSLGSGPVGTAIVGGTGSGGASTATSTANGGGAGAVSPLGGAGPSRIASGSGQNGENAQTNSGSGGGGAGGGTVNGSGGGAGGYIEAMILSSITTYPYVVGAGGLAGAGAAATGGVGGSGYIEVIELYQ